MGQRQGPGHGERERAQGKQGQRPNEGWCEGRKRTVDLQEMRRGRTSRASVRDTTWIHVHHHVQYVQGQRTHNSTMCLIWGWKVHATASETEGHGQRWHLGLGRASTRTGESGSDDPMDPDSECTESPNAAGHTERSQLSNERTMDERKCQDGRFIATAGDARRNARMEDENHLFH